MLHVFEVPAEMPTEYVTRLMNRLKKETAEANCLILHNKSFTLLCRKGVHEEDAERMKQSIFSVRDVKG